MAGSDTSTTYVIVDKDDLVAMADSVREATGSEEKFDVGGLKDALIAAIEAGSSSGMKYATGTFTVASDSNLRVAITHNLDVLPNIFLVRPELPIMVSESHYQVAGSTLVVFDHEDVKKYTGENVVINKGATEPTQNQPYQHGYRRNGDKITGNSANTGESWYGLNTTRVFYTPRSAYASATPAAYLLAGVTYHWFIGYIDFTKIQEWFVTCGGVV